MVSICKTARHFRYLANEKALKVTIIGSTIVYERITQRKQVHGHNIFCIKRNLKHNCNIAITSSPSGAFWWSFLYLSFWAHTLLVGLLLIHFKQFFILSIKILRLLEDHIVPTCQALFVISPSLFLLFVMETGNR